MPRNQGGGEATRWKKGQSGNPKGRPPGTRNVTSMVRLLMEQPVTVQDGARELEATRLQRALVALVERADKGDLSCIKYLLGELKRGEIREPAIDPMEEMRARMFAAQESVRNKLGRLREEYEKEQAAKNGTVAPPRDAT
jgi:Family of unknown function (DUF5681)